MSIIKISDKMMFITYNLYYCLLIVYHQSMFLA